MSAYIKWIKVYYFINDDKYVERKREYKKRDEKNKNLSIYLSLMEWKVSTKSKLER